MPLGFEEQRSERGVVWLRSSMAEALRAAGVSSDDRRTFDVADVGGRVPLRTVAAGGQTVLIRDFTHGGLAGRALGLFPGMVRAYLDPRRPFVELGLMERLAAVGIPVPTAAFARAQRGPIGWRLQLGTVRLGGDADLTRDLGDWLGRLRRGEVAPRAAQRLARAAGRLVARLHEVGFHHADLQPANLLVVGDPAQALPTVFALDLDGSRFLPDLASGARHRNLARLWRHVRRREERYGASLSRADRARFLRAWAAHTRRGAKPAGARTVWREAWRAIDVLETRGRWLHRLGWAVGRLIGAPPDLRARPKV
ncbi:MAG: lipopolysaccharide kinase InaA family protein [Planctomycetota bacterium]